MSGWQGGEPGGNEGCCCHPPAASDYNGAMPASPFAHLSRRRWLGVSSLGFLSASMPAMGRTSDASQPAVAKPIKSCIIVFHYGGPSQFETYDPKPNAPAHIRGEYKQISTVVPGTQVGEHLPRM